VYTATGVVQVYRSSTGYKCTGIAQVYGYKCSTCVQHEWYKVWYNVTMGTRVVQWCNGKVVV